MALSKGDHLGPYEIVALIGAGGMGEVYKARDARLDRTVAIKVSKTEFSERFEREAKAIAALNHPHICQIYDVGPNYLVMEHIEGEPLKGPLPLDKALEYAGQITSALDAAHTKKITHRDLKPANILVTKSAGVKLVDFGLAKLDKPVSVDEETVAAGLTVKGQILGTLLYMSPEQVNGQEVDARSDIFSFGLVLFEMLAGKRAFDGATAASVMSAILERPAPSVGDVAPAALDRVLKRCLEKDPEHRWQSARDLNAALELVTHAVPAAAVAAPALPRWGWLWPGAAALLVLTSAWSLWNRPAAAPKSAVRLTIALPPGQELTTYPAITPDGRTVAYMARQGSEEPLLYLRDLHSFEARAVAGSNGAKQPFFSPDGKWVAFFAQGQLQKVEVAGGTPVKVVDAAIGYGGVWNEDNTIIYAPTLGSGLMRIPATGGTPESLTRPDGAGQGYAHTYPAPLPGGHKVLFSVWGQGQGGAVLSLDSRKWDVVLSRPGDWSVPIFEASSGSRGRLLVVDQSANIRAAPFDSAGTARASADSSVLGNVYFQVEDEPRGWLDISRTGVAVYAPANPVTTSLVWVDREGKAESASKEQGLNREVDLSPDGTKALVRYGAGLWIQDLQRGALSRLTPPGNSNIYAHWSRDGKRIIFGSNRGGDWDIYSQPADGSRPAEALLKRPSDQFPVSVAAGGHVLYVEIQPQTGRDLWTLSTEGKATPFQVSPSNETEGQFSPDGKWVAYGSDESGRMEVYVQSYPGGEKRLPVSSGGGFQPRWSRDGKELFYIAGDAVMAAAIRPDGSAAIPRKLFDRSNYFIKFHSYDVSPDGKRFLMIRRDEGSVPRQLNVILNWSAVTP